MRVSPNRRIEASCADRRDFWSIVAGHRLVVTRILAIKRTRTCSQGYDGPSTS